MPRILSELTSPYVSQALLGAAYCQVFLIYLVDCIDGGGSLLALLDSDIGSGTRNYWGHPFIGWPFFWHFCYDGGAFKTTCRVYCHA